MWYGKIFYSKCYLVVVCHSSIWAYKNVKVTKLFRKIAWKDSQITFMIIIIYLNYNYTACNWLATCLNGWLSAGLTVWLINWLANCLYGWLTDELTVWLINWLAQSLNGWLTQGLQILLMSGVTVTSASQILESFWNIWSQVSQWKSHFQTFQHVVLACLHYREGYTK